MAKYHNTFLILHRPISANILGMYGFSFTMFRREPPAAFDYDTLVEGAVRNASPGVELTLSLIPED